MYIGNYDFWYESSQLILRQMKDQNKKAEQRAKELKEFIARFSANASKSKQATSRKKELERLTIEDIKPSSRKYPYINFEFTQEIGKEVLKLEGISKKGMFSKLTFNIEKGQKVAFFAKKQSGIDHPFQYHTGHRKSRLRKCVRRQDNQDHFIATKQRQLFRRQYHVDSRLAKTILKRPKRNIYPLMAWQNAFHGRRKSQTCKCAFWWRARKMYACKDDARARQPTDFRRTNKPPRP